MQSDTDMKLFTTLLLNDTKDGSLLYGMMFENMWYTYRNTLERFTQTCYQIVNINH